jgi:hypothetical protein
VFLDGDVKIHRRAKLLQAVEMVNDHTVDCSRHAELRLKGN